MKCICIQHVQLCAQNCFHLNDLPKCNTSRVSSVPIDCNLDERCFMSPTSCNQLAHTLEEHQTSPASRRQSIQTAACSIICFSSCAVCLYLAEAFSSWQVIAEKLLQDLLVETELPEKAEWCCPVQIGLLQ